VNATIHRISDREPEPETLPIVKGIPLPPERYNLTLKRTLKALKIGDSFLADRSQQNHVHDRAKNLGIKVVMRKVDNDKWRVWRKA
jgi:hypothetical protein